MISIQSIAEEAANNRSKILDLSSTIGNAAYIDDRLGFTFSDSLLARLADHVTVLKLENNYLEEVPEFVTKLVKLRELRLGKNGFTQIPLEPLRRLPKLRVLSLFENDIAVLPAAEELSLLAALTSLSLSDNQIVEISSLSALRKLEFLDVSRNPIKCIPQSVLDLPRLRKLNLQNPGCPQIIADCDSRNIMPGLLDGEVNSLRDHLYNLSEDGPDAVKTVKAIVFGNTRVGKSTIIQNLMTGGTIGVGEPPARTPSVTIKRLMLDDWSFFIWDLGGEEHHRYFQQYFFTPDTIYMYVMDNQTGSDGDDWLPGRYWVEFVNSRPFLANANLQWVVVTNSIRNMRPSERYVLERKELKQLLPNAAFVDVNCFNTKHLHNQVDFLKQTLRKAADELETKTETDILPIRALTDEFNKAADDVVQKQDLVPLLAGAGANGKYSALEIIEKLITKGVMLNAQIDGYRSDFVAVRPNNMADRFSQIVAAAKRNDGIIAGDDLDRILKKLPDKAAGDFVDMLEELQLIFHLPAPQEEYIVPTALKSVAKLRRTPAETDFVPVKLVLTLSPYIPLNLIHSLADRLRQRNDPGHLTHGGDGLVIDDRKNNVWLDLFVDLRKNRILITAIGTKAWAHIQEKLLNLISEFTRNYERRCNLIEDLLSCSTVILCNCDYCLHATSPHEFKLQDLTQFKEEIECRKSKTKVPVIRLKKGTPTPTALIAYDSWDWTAAAQITELLAEHGVNVLRYEDHSAIGSELARNAVEWTSSTDITIFLASARSLTSAWCALECQLRTVTGSQANHDLAIIAIQPPQVVTDRLEHRLNQRMAGVEDEEHLARFKIWPESLWSEIRKRLTDRYFVNGYDEKTCRKEVARLALQIWRRKG